LAWLAQQAHDLLVWAHRLLAEWAIWFPRAYLRRYRPLALQQVWRTLTSNSLLILCQR
jgi:hypothetical protein